nr:hypothetical protein [Tanacetum cinerariifolium]
MNLEHLPIQETKLPFKMAGLLFKKFKGDRVKVLLVRELREMLQALREKMLQVKKGLLSVTIFKVKGIWKGSLDEEQLAFLADPGILDGQATQTTIPQNAAFQTDDLDTYDSDSDDISSAKAVLMANLSSYDSNVLSEQVKLDAKDVSIAKLRKHIESLKDKIVVEKDLPSNNAKVIAPKMFKLDLEPLSPKVLKNKNAHTDYIKHSQEYANTLWEIVKYARALRPLDNHLDSVCNIKKNRISRTTSSNQKSKVEDHPRSIKSNSNKTNCVIEPVCNANVKHSMLNANSKLICATCNECMFDAIHALCVLDFVNDVNVRSKSKSAKSSKKKNIWKQTGKVFTDIRYRWKPTGWTFTIVGNMCPLTRFTSTKVVPLKETTSKSVITQNPEVKIYSKRPKVTKSLGSSSKSKIVESRISNNSEPNQSWGSNASDVPSFSLVDFKLSKLFYGRGSCDRLFYPKQSLIRKHDNKTPYELLHNKKPESYYLHVFGALCYPTNDSENLGKLKPKADIGIFIGYAPAKKAYQIYNKRTRLIIKTIHVNFDELTAMAFEQFSLGPRPQLLTPRTVSLGLVPNPFSPTPNEYFTLSPSVASPVLIVFAPKPVNSTNTPSSTTIDQDAL